MFLGIISFLSQITPSSPMPLPGGPITYAPSGAGWPAVLLAALSGSGFIGMAVLALIKWRQDHDQKTLDNKDKDSERAVTISASELNRLWDLVNHQTEDLGRLKQQIEELRRENDQLRPLVAENAALRAEVASVKAELAVLKAGAGKAT